MCVFGRSKLYLMFFLPLALDSCAHQEVKTQQVRTSVQGTRKIQKPVETSKREETVADSTHAVLHIYFEGLRNKAQGNYDKALESFNRFLNQNPDHLYADRAQFLIVDCYFLSGEYSLAVVASHQMEKQFPESQKLPEALYKRALSHLAMKQVELGLDTLRFIQQEFSNSAVTDLVLEKLNELKGLKEST